MMKVKSDFASVGHLNCLNAENVSFESLRYKSDEKHVFCLVFVMPLCVSVYLCLVVTCWERADLLALVCGV